MNKNIKRALEILASLDPAHETGRFEVSPEIYYQIEEYETKERKFGRYESHEKYADIQCMLEGEEMIYCVPAKELEAEENFLAKRDVIFYKKTEKGTPKLLKKGEPIILYPGDGHMAGICSKERQRVKKAVFKVRCGENDRDVSSV